MDLRVLKGKIADPIKDQKIKTVQMLKMKIIRIKQ